MTCTKIDPADSMLQGWNRIVYRIVGDPREEWQTTTLQTTGSVEIDENFYVIAQ